MQKIIDSCGQGHRGAAGRRRRRGDVRQRGRPALSAEGLAVDPRGHALRHRRAQAADQGAVRRQLSVGSGGDGGACGRQRRAGSRARSSPASTIPTWACGRRMRRGALRLRTDGHRQDLEADVQHQCRVRLAGRRPLDRPARQERGLLLARRRHPGVGADDRPAGGERRPQARSKDAGPATPVFANTGVNIDNVADVLSIADGAVIGTHFKVGGDTWNAVDKTRVKRFMDKVRKLR